MNSHHDWMVTMLGGVAQDQQRQSLSATGQQFAARFEQLLWPLEELVAEWKGSKSNHELRFNHLAHCADTRCSCSGSSLARSGSNDPFATHQQ